jgi:uncharacterized protein YggT (Ycf19 family)
MIRLLLKIVYIFNTAIETLILTRIVLGIFKANMNNSIVEWIFSTSDLFISPFKDITASTLVIDSIEISITPIIALAIFAIIGFILSELLRAFKHD